jgi:hypothetical protein
MLPRESVSTEADCARHKLMIPTISIDDDTSDDGQRMSRPLFRRSSLASVISCSSFAPSEISSVPLVRFVPFNMQINKELKFQVKYDESTEVSG